MLCASCFSGGRCIGSLSPNLWTPHLQSAQTQLPHSLICLSTHSNTNGKCAATHTKLMCSSFAGCPKSSTLSWPEQCCCVARPSQSYSFTSCGGNATKRKSLFFYTHVFSVDVQQLRTQEAMKNFTTTNVFGTHMTLKQQMEQKLVSQFHRLPGLPSAFCGLDTLRGADDDFGFEDWFDGMYCTLYTPSHSYSLPHSHRCWWVTYRPWLARAHGTEPRSWYQISALETVNLCNLST